MTVAFETFAREGLKKALGQIEEAFKAHYLAKHQEDPEAWPLVLSEKEWVTALEDFLSGYEVDLTL